VAIRIGHQRGRIRDDIGHVTAGTRMGIAPAAEVFGNVLNAPTAKSGAIIAR
jgi:hypothetical protein